VSPAQPDPSRFAGARRVHPDLVLLLFLPPLLGVLRDIRRDLDLQEARER
jgi:hypothetical protein